MNGLIVTADDFGLDVAINEAVERGHREGVLSAASLMVAGPAAADALARARALPALRVGLHLVLVDGSPVLPPDQIPDLVGRDGRFRDNLLAAGVRFFASRAARRQLRVEIDAQFAAFRATGLVLDHVNAHNHMHVHPTVCAIVAELAAAHGNVPVRIPYEPPVDSWRMAGHGLPRRLGGALGLRPWLGLMRRRLRRRGLRGNDRTFGMFDTGAMNEALLLRLVERLPEGVTEVYLHPAARVSAELARAMPGYRGTEELGALLSLRVRDGLERVSVRTGGFRDLLRAP